MLFFFFYYSAWYGIGWNCNLKKGRFGFGFGFQPFLGRPLRITYALENVRGAPVVVPRLRS